MTRNYQNPARYFPIENGRYEVKPGLHRFGTSFGNGAADSHLFQIDRHFETHHRGKSGARSEALEKYFRTFELSQPVERVICDFIARRLAAEHPSFFSIDYSDGIMVRSHLTGQTIYFSEGGDYVHNHANMRPPFASGFDALACQVQEDLVVISIERSRHWLSAIHLCFPNHWAAEDKIGKTFAEIHEPVAGIGPINQRADEFVRTMVNATDGLVRFAWGITTDNQLNHHPDQPAGRPFNILHPRAFLRIERQTIWGFPSVGASLFTIRTFFIDCLELQAAERTALACAVRSMTPQSLRYKGIEPYFSDLLRWLDAGCPQT